jgi:glutathione S-transferase
MPSLMMVVGNKNLSSWSLRPWLALKQTGEAFDEVVIQLDRPDTREKILAYSPSGRVPCLRDGDTTVWDSLAICEYLAEKFPEAKLWPADTVARATARSVSAEMHSGFQALRSNMPMRIRESLPGQGIADGVQRDIDRIFDIWRDTRRRFGWEGPYLFGAFSIADAMFAPVVTRFRTYGVPLDDTCGAYAEAIWRHEPMEEWVEAARREP